jgi:hypothetical protein
VTDRERWIVYPLLFLALGSALRDKLAKQTQAKQIVCEQLLLVDNDGRPAAALTGNELRFDVGGIGNGHIVGGKIEALTFLQRGQPVLSLGLQQQISLPQLLQQVLPQLQMAPGLPQGETAPPTPGQETPPAGEAPNQDPVNPAAPQTTTPDSEPAPAA